MDYDFANILFAGPCNARCPDCIGKQVDSRLNLNNLDLFPLHNLERFVGLIQQHGVRQVVFSGTTTDPQLYRHLPRLLETLRRRLGPQASFSLHTNGRLALRKLADFNRFDRVCISFPSFDPLTYRQMMGVPDPPDLAEIVRRAQVPLKRVLSLKLSCLVDGRNAPEIAAYLERCLELGIPRLVLRKLYGDPRPWSTWIDPIALGFRRVRDYRSNPVYDYRGLEVTLWDFAGTESRSLNLFSSGEISDAYLLAQAAPAAQAGPAGWQVEPVSQSLAAA